MADQKGFGNVGQIPVFGTSKEDVESIENAWQESLKALQQRYDQPNWYKVAAGFLKPQLGGFFASLGSANEALGEQMEKRREMEIPISQMRSQIALSKLYTQKNIDVANQIQDWQSKPENAGKLPPPSLIANWKSKAPELPAVQAFADQAREAREQQEIQVRSQENAFRAAELNRQLGITVPGAGTIASPTTVTGGAPPPIVPPTTGGPAAPPALDNTDIIARIESGNRPEARNPQSTASGRMQVLEGTAKDPGFGVTPAQNDSEEERTRVGKDYFHAMEKRYGNPTLGALAYTWGPDNVDKWIAGGANWKDVPQDKKDYVGQFAILQANPNARTAAEPPKAERKILDTGDSRFNPLYTQADASRLRGATDENLNKIATDRYASLEAVANPQTYAESQAALDQMIKTIQKNPELVKKVTNPLAQQGGLLGGILNAAEAGMGFSMNGLAGNIHIPVSRAIIGAYDPKTEAPFFNILNTQAAKIALIQQRMNNVNPSSIRNGEIDAYRAASVHPETQGPNVMLYNLQYTKLNNEMLHEMYTKANAILNGKDPDYALNPNSRRGMMDILTSPVMEGIEKKYSEKFSALNSAFQNTLGAR